MIEWEEQFLGKFILFEEKNDFVYKNVSTKNYYINVGVIAYLKNKKICLYRNRFGPAKHEYIENIVKKI